MLGTDPFMIAAVEEGLKKASNLPSCCGYKQALLNDLNKMLANLKKMQAGLNSSTKLTIGFGSWKPNSEAAKVPPALTWSGIEFPEVIKINIGAATSFNLLKYDIEGLVGQFFHEISHFSSGANTEDYNENGPVIGEEWNWGTFYQLFGMSPSLDGLANILLMRDFKRKFGAGCPHNAWPGDNIPEPKKYEPKLTK